MNAGIDELQSFQNPIYILSSISDFEWAIAIRVRSGGEIAGALSLKRPSG